MKLQEIKSGLNLSGVEPTEIVSVVATVPQGEGALQLIYRTPNGSMKERLLLVADEPGINVATMDRQQYEARQREQSRGVSPEAGAGFRDHAGSTFEEITGREAGGSGKDKGGDGGGRVLPRSFHGTVEVAPATAKMRMVQIADEIIAVLGSDPNASVKVVVEIAAEFPDGAKDAVKRAVSENARTLGLKSADWE
jgi:hypothetical protein